MSPDDLEARRWLRELFRKLGEQYPDLKTTEQRERLAAELHKQAEQTASKSYLQKWGVQATVLDRLTPYRSILASYGMRASFCRCAAWLLIEMLYSGYGRLSSPNS